MMYITAPFVQGAQQAPDNVSYPGPVALHGRKRRLNRTLEQGRSHHGKSVCSGALPPVPLGALSIHWSGVVSNVLSYRYASGTRSV